MSLQTQLTALVNAVAGDIKTIWSLMNGKAANLDGLQTSEKSSLVAAINEVNGNAPSVVSLVKNGDLDIGTTEWKDITGWTSVVADDDFAFDDEESTITIQADGIYMVSFNAVLDQYAGNNRAESWCRVVVNDALLPGTAVVGYHRVLTQGADNYSASVIVPLEADDVLRLQATDTSASHKQSVIADGTSLYVMKLRST